LYFLSISFQKIFPGIFPARAQYFLLLGNFLASGSFGYTAISIKVVPEQSRKVEYERERLLGIAKKLMIY
jgi:hypothetical protein